MELIHQDGYVKVYAAQVGDYWCVWESAYPCRDRMIATCDTKQEAKEAAELYAECLNTGVAF